MSRLNLSSNYSQSSNLDSDMSDGYMEEFPKKDDEENEDEAFNKKQKAIKKALEELAQKNDDDDYTSNIPKPASNLDSLA